MRANPNESLRRTTQDFISPTSLCVFMVQRAVDHEDFVHELTTVLGDLLHTEPASQDWADVTDAATPVHDGGTVLVTTANYPASIKKVNDALAAVAERHGVSGAVWTWGPCNIVRVEDHE